MDENEKRFLQSDIERHRRKLSQVVHGGLSFASVFLMSSTLRDQHKGLALWSLGAFAVAVPLWVYAWSVLSDSLDILSGKTPIWTNRIIRSVGLAYALTFCGMMMEIQRISPIIAGCFSFAAMVATHGMYQAMNERDPGTIEKPGPTEPSK